MTLKQSELDRIADDIYKDRIITSSIYCGTCGYNLRTLPHLHVCPECGHRYNARPLKMDGIFNPNEIEFPLSDIIVLLLLGLGVYYLARDAFNPPDETALTFAGLLVILAGSFAWNIFVKTRRFVSVMRVVKRVEAQEQSYEE